MIIRIDISELQTYFGERFPGFENSMLFDQLEFDLQTDPLTKEFLPIYNGIMSICQENDLIGFENDLFSVFLLSDQVNIRRDFIRNDYVTIVKDVRELFTVFDSLVSAKFRNIKETKTLYIQGHRIESQSLLHDVKQTIFNKVTSTLKKPNWNQLPQHEKIMIIETVKNYLDETKPKRGQPQKTQLARLFVSCFHNYLKSKIPDHVFKSGRHLHLFLGRLTVLYGVLPEPDNLQINQGNEFYIKTVENLLPKN